MTSATRAHRFGPVEVIDRTLVIGTPLGHHVRLHPDALSHRNEHEELQRIDWSHPRDLSLRLPHTRFPYPGIAARLGLVLFTVLSSEVLEMEPERSSLDLRTDQGTLSVRLDAHIGGYWKNSVTAAERLLALFATHPAHRALLAQPEAVFSRYVALARWGRPIR